MRRPRDPTLVSYFPQEPESPFLHVGRALPKAVNAQYNAVQRKGQSEQARRYRIFPLEQLLEPAAGLSHACDLPQGGQADHDPQAALGISGLERPGESRAQVVPAGRNLLEPAGLVWSLQLRAGRLGEGDCPTRVRVVHALRISGRRQPIARLAFNHFAC